MAYPLQALVLVADRRENAAAALVAAAEQEWRDACRAVERCQEEVKRYGRWRVEEEKRLFESIRETPVARKRLDEHNEAIRALRQREADLEQALVDAEADRDKKAAALAEAKDAHREALKEKQKIAEHRARWIEGEKVEALRSEEAELEESFRPAADSAEEMGPWENPA